MYGILIDHKFDPDHIITIMYGDLPDDKHNPFPGTIFNHPGNNQRNYQEGLVIDYDHKYKLTKELYLNILLGKEDVVRDLTKIENPKVLKTNKDDHIFLYYIDHGGDNIVEMPDGPFLTARELVQTIVTMHEEGKYGKLVYYLEACESGSMWQTLPTDINAYALSSTYPDESSWGTYCPPNDDIVDGVHIGSCLGEVWSCFWLEQDDVADLTTLTLQKQFDDAKEFTTTSHPLQFGDLEIAKEPVGDYISEIAGRRRFLRSENRRVEQWDSRLNDLLFWKNRALDANDKEAYAKYMEFRQEGDEERRHAAEPALRREELALLQRCVGEVPEHLRIQRLFAEVCSYSCEHVHSLQGRCSGYYQCYVINLFGLHSSLFVADTT